MKRIFGFIFVPMFLVCLCLVCSKETKKVVISDDGVPIRFYSQGQGEPSLVFVHGFASDHQDWRFQTSHFSSKYTVVTLDLAGFGESGNNRKEWIPEAFGNDVVSVIEHLKLKKVILIGQSMGGGVILEAARQIPDRVIGLVPVDVFQNVEETFTDDQIEQRINRIMEMVNQPDRHRLRGAFKREVDPSIIEKIIETYQSAPKIGWRECLRSFILWRMNQLTAVLQQIRCPITCINSNRIKTEVEIARKYYPRFNVRIIKNTGHPVMLDAPDEFNQALEEIIDELIFEID